jgi:phosphoglycerate kinase
MGLDCGPKSAELFAATVAESKTILWNGPAGVFEFPAFAKGSNALLEACIKSVKNGSTVIVGGGDTATLVANAGKEEELSHVSTGGGASLELLEGKVSLLIDMSWVELMIEPPRCCRVVRKEVEPDIDDA